MKFWSSIVYNLSIRIVRAQEAVSPRKIDLESGDLADALTGDEAGPPLENPLICIATRETAGHT